MKRIILVIFILLNLIFLTACTQRQTADIVTTMFPQYDFARQIVGDYMTVSQIIAPGAEIHNYEATSQDMVSIRRAKLFIYTSLEIDTWIKNPDTIGGDETVVLDLSKTYTLVSYPVNMPLDTDHEHANELHYWTDPTTAIQLIQAILEQIVLIDPAHELDYRQNALDYINSVEDLNIELERFLMGSAYYGSTIYFAGHNAMGAFAERYHLNIVSLFEEFKPDADLTSNELITFTNEVKLAATHYLFIEELATPKAANTIKNQLAQEGYQLTLLELHGYHNVSKTDFEENVTYRDLMERNLDQLKLAIVNR